jgi:competence protein ComEC
MIVSAIVLLIFAKTRLLASLLLGGFLVLIQAYSVPNDQLLPELEGKDGIVTGNISIVPEHGSQTIRFKFIPDKRAEMVFPRKLGLNCYKPLPLALGAGERWQLTVRLKQIHGMV